MKWYEDSFNVSMMCLFGCILGSVISICTCIVACVAIHKLCPNGITQ